MAGDWLLGKKQKLVDIECENLLLHVLSEVGIVKYRVLS
jgi:hypothetical protein